MSFGGGEFVNWFFFLRDFHRNSRTQPILTQLRLTWTLDEVLVFQFVIKMHWNVKLKKHIHMMPIWGRRGRKPSLPYTFPRSIIWLRIEPTFCYNTIQNRTPCDLLIWSAVVFNTPSRSTYWRPVSDKYLYLVHNTNIHSLDQTICIQTQFGSLYVSIYDE